MLKFSAPENVKPFNTDKLPPGVYRWSPPNPEMEKFAVLESISTDPLAHWVNFVYYDHPDWFRAIPAHEKRPEAKTMRQLCVMLEYAEEFNKMTYNGASNIAQSLQTGRIIPTPHVQMGASMVFGTVVAWYALGVEYDGDMPRSYRKMQFPFPMTQLYVNLDRRLGDQVIDYLGPDRVENYVREYSERYWRVKLSAPGWFESFLKWLRSSPKQLNDLRSWSRNRLTQKEIARQLWEIITQ